MLHLYFSASVNISKNYRPFLPSQFFFVFGGGLLLFFPFVACCKIQTLTSHMKFLSSIYLSSASQLNMGCCMMGLPIMGNAFCHSIIIVCAHCGHGLYCHSCCLNCYLYHCLGYSILLSCQLIFFYLLGSFFCESAFFLTAYVEHFCLPSLDFYS